MTHAGMPTLDRTSFHDRAQARRMTNLSLCRWRIRGVHHATLKFVFRNFRYPVGPRQGGAPGK